MRRFFYVLVILGIGFALGAGYREIRAEIVAKRHLKKTRTAYATQPVMENRSFVIVTYAENNEDLIEQNILSSLSQNYSDFRIVFIDDGLDKDMSFLEKFDPAGRVTYVKNEEAKGSIESLYRVIQECRSDEVVVLLRGEEIFTHHYVLAHLNRYFADRDVWVASGEVVDGQSFEKGGLGENYQVFYAGLFKHIKLQDFLSYGHFRRGEYEDVATHPLLELAGEHAYVIPEPLLINFKKIERKEETPSKNSYGRLKENPWHDTQADQEKIDIVVFSDNRPLQLYAFLESANRYVSYLNQYFVIYRAGNDHYEQGYQKVKEAFPDVVYLRQSVESPHEDFAPLLQKAVFDRYTSQARFVAFALDGSIVKDFIDLEDAAHALKATGAHGFYFRLGRNLKTHSDEKRIPIFAGIQAWQFEGMEGEWGIPNSVDMTLFRKSDIYPH
ncbi:MAG: glycosyltransferase, partial [Chlamydiia bacterium]|nr:glycosyltransferase [Chlamydiia bacterium]